jgi:hypothetical protein
MRKGCVFSIFLLTAIVCLPAVAQKATDDRPEPQEVPRFKVLSTRFITEAKGLFGTSWSTTSAERTGLVVTVEASLASESFEVKPASFFIEYSLGGGSRFDEECFGLNSLDSSTEPKPDEWVLVGPGMQGFLRLRRTEQGTASFALLFSVSKKIREFSLVYRHPTVVVKAVVTR